MDATPSRYLYRITCACCEAKAEWTLGERWRDDNVLPPVANKSGWKRTAGRNECARCAAKNAPAVRRRAAEAVSLFFGGSQKEVVNMADAKPALRDATQPERIKIRAVLDKHFDDDAGCWLDGYSDQKAGDEIGIPWAIVTRIREAAYGPIRVDPEIAGLRAELTQIGRELAALTEKHAAAAKRVEALAGKRAAA